MNEISWKVYSDLNLFRQNEGGGYNIVWYLQEWAVQNQWKLQNAAQKTEVYMESHDVSCFPHIFECLVKLEILWA